MRTQIGARPASALSFAGRRTSALVEAILVYMLIAILAAFAGFTSFTTAAPANWAGLETLEGVISVRHGDDFSHGREVGHSYFLTSATGDRELAFDGDPPADSLSGARIRVHGVGQGSRFLVAAGGTQKVSSPSGGASGASGAKRVAVVLFNFENDASQPYTPAFADGIAFSNVNSVAAYYAETSWGQLTISGDVFGWYTLPATNDGCATGIWATAATAQATAAGIDLGTYDNVVYAFPDAPSCPWSGLAAMPGRTAWLNGTSGMTLHTMAHELGHNFGTHHASSLTCTENGVRVSLSSSCAVAEYGDPFSVMGGGGHYLHTSFSRGNFGWLSKANTVTVTTTGDYALMPIEDSDPTMVDVLRVPRGDTGTYLTLEFRQPSGTYFDTFSPLDPVTTGVTVRLTAGYTAPTQTRLVDATPATQSYADAALAIGKTLVDPLSGVAITTVSVSASAVSVRVSFGVIAPTSTPVPTSGPTPTSDPTATPAPTPAPDAVAPTAPTELVATLGKGRKVALSWTASSDNVGVVGYRVFRDGVQVASTAGTTLVDALIGKSKINTYYVVAFDGAGNTSAGSNLVSVTP
jgi:hypothetical protein